MLRVLVIVLLAGCGGSTSLKKAGESCTSSSECDPGLLCDTGQHVCADKGSVDAAEPIDAAMIDAQMNDAKPIDAKPDAPVDAAVDAAVDAPDAM